VSVWGTILDLEDDKPYEYRGSHILPSEDDPRDGVVQLAEVPSHITRDGRDDQPEDGTPWPWLRLSVNQADVVLNRAQAREMHERLGAWLEQADGSGSAYGQLRAQLEADLQKMTACAAQPAKPGVEEGRIAQGGIAAGIRASLAWVIHHFEGPEARAAFLNSLEDR